MVEAQLDDSVSRTSACTPTPGGYFTRQSESRRKGQNHVTRPQTQTCSVFRRKKGFIAPRWEGNFLYSLSLLLLLACL
jgi:hypothetical protein